MHINKIEKINTPNSKKYKIFSDDNYLFSLYESEIKQYGFIEGDNIEDDVVNYINDEIIYKRAKERALFLLEKQPYTEYMLRRKLSLGGYTDYIIDEIMIFLNKYNYINDFDYALMYLKTYAYKKSRKQIISILNSKGVDLHITINAIEQFYSELSCSDDLDNDNYNTNYDPEEVCLKKQFDKYIKGKDISDPIIRQKTFRHFYGKGFNAESINKLFSFT